MLTTDRRLVNAGWWSLNAEGPGSASSRGLVRVGGRLADSAFVLVIGGAAPDP